MPTLYISDLDGTLLRGDQQVSLFSLDILNRAMDAGLLFSVATARSLIGIQLLPLDALRFRVPLVLMNGVMLYDMAAKKIVQSCVLDAETVKAVLEACAAEGKTPFLYRALDNEVHAFFTGLTSEGERAFCAKRCAALPHLFHKQDAYEYGPGVYLSMQDTKEKLERVRRRLDALPGVASTLYKDNYMEDNWYLEVFSGQAGKDNGARRLQKRVGADRLVAFGDNLNDLPLFAAADVACCVESGQREAREAADVLVRGNNDDGVARYIQQVWEAETGC